MYRGLIFGALAFAAAFAAERQFDAMSGDMKRYDKMRAMSGDPPLLQQLLSGVVTMATDFAGSKADEAGDLFTGMTRDLVRYATMRNM